MLQSYFAFSEIMEGTVFLVSDNAAENRSKISQTAVRLEQSCQTAGEGQNHFSSIEQRGIPAAAVGQQGCCSFCFSKLRNRIFSVSSFVSSSLTNVLYTMFCTLQGNLNDFLKMTGSPVLCCCTHNFMFFPFSV